MSTNFTAALEAGLTTPSIWSVHTCIASLGSVGFPVPSWEAPVVRSQSGPLTSVPFTVMPTSRVTRIASDLFRVLLLRRFRSPLHLCVRSCRCGRLLDVLGHHRAACSTGGALERSSFAVESAVAQLPGRRNSGVSECNVAGPRH